MYAIGTIFPCGKSKETEGIYMLELI